MEQLVQLDQLVLRVPKVTLAHLDNLDSQVTQDLLDLMVSLAIPDNQETGVLLAIRDLQDLMAIQGLPVQQDLPD